MDLSSVNKNGLEIGEVAMKLSQEFSRKNLTKNLNRETSVEREKDVQAIHVHRECEKLVFTLWVREDFQIF